MMDTDTETDTTHEQCDSPAGAAATVSMWSRLDNVQGRMLVRVANSDGHFKSQQRGEPDLSFEEKLQIATELLEQKPSTFLNRYSKFLKKEDLAYFEPKKDDYTIDFYLKEAKKRLDDSKNKTKVRNRRYEAMKQLMDKGEYFGDTQMKSRDPLLYEQMVGQHLSPDEVQKLVDETDGSISSVLMHHIEAIHNNEVYAQQVMKQESQMEEEDSETDEEETEDEQEYEEGFEPKSCVSEEEKKMLRQEFIAVMQQRFISGDDDFDYRTVDDNVEYDSLDIRAQDEEESYFDAEDEEDEESRELEKDETNSGDDVDMEKSDSSSKAKCDISESGLTNGTSTNPS